MFYLTFCYRISSLSYTSYTSPIPYKNRVHIHLYISKGDGHSWEDYILLIVSLPTRYITNIRYNIS